MTKTKEEKKTKEVRGIVDEVEEITPEKYEKIRQTLVIPEGQPLVPKDFKNQLTRKQIEVIKEQFAKGATDVELQMFIYVCQRTALDPFSKQIHLVPRWDSRLGKEIRSVVIGIDGLRSIAERTGAYAGNTDPHFEGEVEAEIVKKDFKTKKDIISHFPAPGRATVTVKKVVQGVLCDFTATAEWAEYYPGGRGGIMWVKMPKNMLGKCAEAKALRKAFPAVMSGLYVAEEIQQAVVQASPEGENKDYERATGMIQRMTKVDDLESLKDKLEGSKKYSKTEKKEMLSLIDKQILSLQPLPKTDKKVADKEPTPDEIQGASEL